MIAISIPGPVDSVAVGDTLRAHATALTGAGDSVAATFYWASFDTTVLAVVDSSNGVFVGRNAGFTSIMARTGDLRSNPLPVTVTAAP